MEPLGHRIDALEQSVARHRRFTTGLAILLVLFLGLGAAQLPTGSSVADVVRAERIELVGKDNRVLASLSPDFRTNETPQLRFFSRSGKETLVIGSDILLGLDAVQMRLFSKDGKETVIIDGDKVDRLGGEIQVCSTVDGQLRKAWIWQGHVSAEQLGICRPGTHSLEIPTRRPGMDEKEFEEKISEFLDATRPVVELSSRDGDGHLVVHNRTAEPVCTMEVDEYGNGKLGVWDRKGKGRTLTPGQ